MVAPWLRPNYVFHPCPIVDEDVFKLWRLDSIEQFNAAEQMIFINRTHTEPREEVRAELLRFLERFFREP